MGEWTRTVKHYLRNVPAAFVATVCCACAIDTLDGEATSAVAGKEQSIGLFQNFTLWESPVNVCFKNDQCMRRCSEVGYACSNSIPCPPNAGTCGAQFKCDDQETVCDEA